MTTKRSLLAPALVLGLTLVVASCGGQPFPEASSAPPASSPAVTGAGATPRARLLAAAQQATGAETARIVLQTSVSVAGHTAVSFTGSGAMDPAREKMTMTVHEFADGVAFDLEMRIIGRTAYVLHDGVWTTVSLARTGAAANVPDPTSYIDYLQGAADDVHVVGHETLRGDPTTRYAATLDLARALTRTTNSPAQQAVIRAAIALHGDLRIPTSVWIDGRGRLRKVAMTIDLASAAKQLGIAPGLSPKVDATLELFDYGAPVVVQVPAGAENAVARTQDITAESDLRNALTAEKVQYTDNETYTSDPILLKQIEPALDWGAKLTVVTGLADGARQQVVCVSERSAAGTTFALADVAVGPQVGTYYGRHACPAVVDETSFRDFRASW